MDSLRSMNNALSYIEENLTGEIDYGELLLLNMDIAQLIPLPVLSIPCMAFSLLKLGTRIHNLKHIPE